MRQQGSNLIGSARNLKAERRKESIVRQTDWNMHTHTHTQSWTYLSGLRGCCPYRSDEMRPMQHSEG